MAARTKAEHNQKTIERIRASQLINRLVAHVLSEDGLLNSSQVRAAEILLRKVIPDLAHTTGEVKHSMVDDLTERLMAAKERTDAQRSRVEH